MMILMMMAGRRDDDQKDDEQKQRQRRRPRRSPQPSASPMISLSSSLVLVIAVIAHQYECVSGQESANHPSRPKGTIDPRVITYPGELANRPFLPLSLCVCERENGDQITLSYIPLTMISLSFFHSPLNPA